MISTALMLRRLTDGLNKDNWWVVALIINVVLFGSIFTIVFAAVRARRKRQRRAASELARDFGLKDIWHSGRRNETDWYVGEYEGMPLLMHGRVITIGGGKHRQNNYCVRMCLCVTGCSAKGIEVRRNLVWRAGALAESVMGKPELRDFESAFTSSKGADEKLPLDFKETLLGFRQSHEGTFLMMDVARVAVGNWKYWFPAKGLPGEPAVLLVHDGYQRELENKPEEMRKRLDELVAIAGKIRTASWSVPVAAAPSETG